MHRPNLGFLLFLRLSRCRPFGSATHRLFGPLFLAAQYALFFSVAVISVRSRNKWRIHWRAGVGGERKKGSCRQSNVTCAVAARRRRSQFSGTLAQGHPALRKMHGSVTLPVLRLLEVHFASSSNLVNSALLPAAKCNLTIPFSYLFACCLIEVCFNAYHIQVFCGTYEKASTFHNDLHC